MEVKMKQSHFHSTKNILEKVLIKTVTFLASFYFLSCPQLWRANRKALPMVLARTSQGWLLCNCTARRWKPGVAVGVPLAPDPLTLAVGGESSPF